MIIDKNSNATTSTKKSTAQENETDDKPSDGDDALDEETIRINRERMAAGKKKGEAFKFYLIIPYALNLRMHANEINKREVNENIKC